MAAVTGDDDLIEAEVVNPAVWALPGQGGHRPAPPAIVEEAHAPSSLISVTGWRSSLPRLQRARLGAEHAVRARVKSSEWDSEFALAVYPVGGTARRGRAPRAR